MTTGDGGDQTAETGSTAEPDYALRLATLGGKPWKRWLGVQAPYRWNTRRLCHGSVLDVGCGIGRNLAHLDGNGVGIDHNPACVAAARERGLLAFTPEEFAASMHSQPARFDTLLLAHVIEHQHEAETIELIRRYLPCLRPGGRIVLITPQEAGQRSDPTHVRLVDFAAAERLARSLGLEVETQRSFPLPRPAGRVFRYNEFTTVCRKQAHG